MMISPLLIFSEYQYYFLPLPSERFSLASRIVYHPRCANRIFLCGSSVFRAITLNHTKSFPFVLKITLLTMRRLVGLSASSPFFPFVWNSQAFHGSSNILVGLLVLVYMQFTFSSISMLRLPFMFWPNAVMAGYVDAELQCIRSFLLFHFFVLAFLLLAVCCCSFLLISFSFNRKECLTRGNFAHVQVFIQHYRSTKTYPVNLSQN